MASERPIIRPMTEDDIPRLVEIRPSFTSDTVLAVERIGSGLEVGWRLVEMPLAQPFNKGHGYDFDLQEQESIRQRFRRGDGLHLVAEKPGQLVGILDLVPQNWNNMAWLWNIMLDESIRGQGIGRELFRRAVTWARGRGFRALGLETQTNNVPACKFYLSVGCRLEGLREMFYTNEDVQRGEVALFWIYPLV